jgi:uncharacterized protein (DUF885 family)
MTAIPRRRPARAVARATTLLATLLLAGGPEAARAQATGTSATGAPGAGAGRATDSARVVGLADEYVAAFVAQFPEAATTINPPNAPPGLNARLSDYSPASVRAWERREDTWLAALARVDRRRLDPHSGWLAGLLTEQLAASRQARVCRRELWALSHVFGWQSNLAQLTDIQPVGSDAARRDAVARVRALGPYVDRETANLRAGLAAGYAEPRVVVERVLAQLDGMLALPDTASPFVGAAQRDSTPGFRDSLVAALREVALPAIRRHRDFLRAEYRPRATVGIGIAQVPNGAACYRAAVRQQTTLALDADAVHRRGLARMDSLQRQMRTIARRAFGTEDLPALFARLARDSAFASREQMVAYNEAVVARARAALPRAFGVPFTQRVAVRPYPPFQEASAPGGQAVFPPVGADSTVPGIYWINASRPLWGTKFSIEALAFHEALPGHLLNGAAMQRATHPLDNVFVNSPGANAFVEGWALYAEGLAGEMGLYSNAMQELGQLSSLAFRAARLVVDPGIHVLGWSRTRAVDYMVRMAGLPREDAETEIDRYASMPGQAAGYMLGEQEIRRVRVRAERALGAGFDLRSFHDALLAHPAVPLPLLQEVVDRWVAGARARAPERGAPEASRPGARPVVSPPAG